MFALDSEPLIMFLYKLRAVAVSGNNESLPFSSSPLQSPHRRTTFIMTYLPDMFRFPRKSLCETKYFPESSPSSGRAHSASSTFRHCRLDMPAQFREIVNDFWYFSSVSLRCFVVAADDAMWLAWMAFVIESAVGYKTELLSSLISNVLSCQSTLIPLSSSSASA